MDIDARWGTSAKGNDKYNTRANVHYETDDNIRGWLDGFINEEGIDRSTSALLDAGLIKRSEMPSIVQNQTTNRKTDNEENPWSSASIQGND